MFETIKWLGLALTTSCNLNCVYCFGNVVRDGDFLDYQKAKKFLNFFSTHSAPKVKLHMTGGEPTLHPRILDLLDYAEKQFLDPYTLVATNGVIPNKKLEDFLERDVVFHITFEGLPDIHDSERPTHTGGKSSKAVLKTIKKIVDEDPRRLILRYNHSRNKFDKEEKIADFISGLGVKQVSIGYITPYGKGATYKNVAPLESQKRIGLFNKLFEKRGVELEHLKSKLTKFMWPSCGAGTHSFFLSVEGKICTCQNLITTTGLNEVESRFVVGDIGKKVNIDEKRLKDFIDFAQDVPEGCKSCDARIYCGGCPLHKKIGKDGTYFPESFCKIRKVVFENLKHQFIKTHGTK